MKRHIVFAGLLACLLISAGCDVSTGPVFGDSVKREYEPVLNGTWNLTYTAADSSFRGTLDVKDTMSRASGTETIGGRVRFICGMVSSNGKFTLESSHKPDTWIYEGQVDAARKNMSGTVTVKAGTEVHECTVLSFTGMRKLTP